MASVLSFPYYAIAGDPKICDPIVSISAHKRKRSAVLKELAAEHGFTLNFDPSQDSGISIQKKRELSEVVNSITRGLNVVLSYQDNGKCRYLSEVSVFSDKEKKGGNGTSIVRQGPKTSAREVNQSKTPRQKSSLSQTPKNSVKSPAKKEALPKEKREMLDEEALASKKAASEKRKSAREARETAQQGIEILDMEKYVQDVIDKKVKLNKRAMTVEQRKEYRDLRRKLLEVQN